jgi:hypothetical protein
MNFVGYEYRKERRLNGMEEYVDSSSFGDDDDDDDDDDEGSGSGSGSGSGGSGGKL